MGSIMGLLWSCCCGGERDGIASEPLLNNSSVYEPSNLADQQHNNPGNISASHIGGGDVPPINGSLRQIDFPYEMRRKDLGNMQNSGPHSTSLNENMEVDESMLLYDYLNIIEKNSFDLDLLAALAHGESGKGSFRANANLCPFARNSVEESCIREKANEYTCRLQRTGHIIAERARASFATDQNSPDELVYFESNPKSKVIYGDVMSDNDSILDVRIQTLDKEALKDFQIE